MHFPRLPDWLVYFAVVLALLFAALGRREHADAPPAPPPLPKGEGEVLANATPFDPTLVVKVTRPAGAPQGTAFSVGDGGVWLTAQSVVAGCARAAILTSETEGIIAKVTPGPMGELAVLTTAAGRRRCRWRAGPRRRTTRWRSWSATPAAGRARWRSGSSAPIRSPRATAKGRGSRCWSGPRSGAPRD